MYEEGKQLWTFPFLSYLWLDDFPKVTTHYNKTQTYNPVLSLLSLTHSYIYAFIQQTGTMDSKMNKTKPGLKEPTV